MCKNVSFLLVLVFLTASCLILAKASAHPDVATENSWTTKASMREARAYLGVAVVNEKIYAIGGDAGLIMSFLDGPPIGFSSSVVNANEEYNPDTDTWTTKTSMPTPRSSFGVAVYENKIYCIGGLTYPGYYLNTGVNEVYDPATDTWQNKTALPTANRLLIANTVNGNIYVLGANDKSFVNEYDPSTDSWATKTPPPCYILGSASFVFDDKIYMIGIDYGNSHGRWPGTFFEIYDPASDSWTLGASTPPGGLSVTACATTGANAPERIYFFDVNRTDVYDPSSGNWTVGEAMPTTRLLAKAATVNDTVYLVGGRSGTIEVYPSTVNQQYVPFGYKTDFTQPNIAIQSPEAKTYYGSNVSLNFTVNEPAVWMQYSLDAQNNVTITGNMTLNQLSYGLHNITVYAQDTAENVGASETIIFTIAEEIAEEPESPEPPEPFPTTLVVASIVTVGAVGVGLLVYFKKRKHLSNPSSTISNNS